VISWLFISDAVFKLDVDIYSKLVIITKSR